jgi:hypothetical protein
MTDPDEQTDETTEAEDVGERPDLGRTPDALREALTGSGGGSDTRAGSLQGGAATGSDDDPDQRAVDQAMREAGRDEPDAPAPSAGGPSPVTNTGAAPGEADGQIKGGGDADAATG